MVGIDFQCEVLEQVTLREAATAVAPLLSDKQVADLLVVTLDWVRGHADEIPGVVRLGSYVRFRRCAIEEWLSSFERLFDAEHAATLLQVPKSWVYANANEIPGVLRLGRYVRFRPAVLNRFLGGSELAQ